MSGPIETSEPLVRTVQLAICQPCLDGIGEECHTPDCALWMHKVDLHYDECVWLRACLAVAQVRPDDTEHPDGLRCPRCRSTNVVCHRRPHGHECRDCNYDGTNDLDPLTQAIDLLRRHADVCSRHGEPDRLRSEADRLDASRVRSQSEQDVDPYATTDRDEREAAELAESQAAREGR